MAASYLKGLHDSYGDWSLAIAAYNCGPGTINKAIRRAGGEPKDHDFWSIYNYLPEETRGYVPAFIAVNYVMNYYPEHNISPVLPTCPLVMDTIHVSDRIHFDQISGVLDIPVEELRILNPQYRADIIPGTPDTPRNLILPSQQIHAYLMSEEEIKHYELEKYAQRLTVEPSENQGESTLAVEDTEIWATPTTTVSDKVVTDGETKTIVHKVKAGETLASIAKAYEVTIDDIKNTNNLRRNAVRVGQQLKIVTASPQVGAESPVPKPEKAPTNTAQTNNQKKPSTPATSKPVSHVVKKGENLSIIAKKYGITVAALKSANGLTNDNIRAGQSLKIPGKGDNGSAAKKTTAKKSTGTKKSTGAKKKR